MQSMPPLSQAQAFQGPLNRVPTTQVNTRRVDNHGTYLLLLAFLPGTGSHMHVNKLLQIDPYECCMIIAISSCGLWPWAEETGLAHDIMPAP